MSVTQLHDTFAVMALVAFAGTLLMVLARLVPSVASVRFLDALYKVQLPLAALVPTVAALGSLYFSEYGNLWQPCRYCWFQRIFMYSSAVVLLLAAVRRDRNIKWYGVTLASIGLVISAWHILLEHGIVTESNVCAATVPCATPYYVSFGKLLPVDGGIDATGLPMTLAKMAFCGFAAIIALLLTPQPLDELTEDHDGEPAAG